MKSINSDLALITYIHVSTIMLFITDAYFMCSAIFKWLKRHEIIIAFMVSLSLTLNGSVDKSGVFSQQLLKGDQRFCDDSFWLRGEYEERKSPSDESESNYYRESNGGGQIHRAEFPQNQRIRTKTSWMMMVRSRNLITLIDHIHIY